MPYWAVVFLDTGEVDSNEERFRSVDGALIAAFTHVQNQRLKRNETAKVVIEIRPEQEPDSEPTLSIEADMTAVLGRSSKSGRTKMLTPRPKHKRPAVTRAFEDFGEHTGPLLKPYERG